MFTRKHALMMTAMVATSLTLPAVAEASTTADFTESCTNVTGGIDCTFTALGGFYLIDTSAADVNLTGGSVDYSTSADTAIVAGGGGATSSTVSGPKNVGGATGTFTVTDTLIGSPPTASSVTFFIEATAGTTLTTADIGANTDGNTYAAHICVIDPAGCSTTFFQSGGGQILTPVPAALPLFAGGLGFVGWLAGRKRKALQVA